MNKRRLDCKYEYDESDLRITSNPFVAGIDSIALARSASSLSNTGDPRPAGIFLPITSITPPTLSPTSLRLQQIDS
jgi:hypothetical protein